MTISTLVLLLTLRGENKGKGGDKTKFVPKALGQVATPCERQQTLCKKL